MSFHSRCLYKSQRNVLLFIKHTHSTATLPIKHTNSTTTIMLRLQLICTAFITLASLSVVSPAGAIPIRQLVRGAGSTGKASGGSVTNTAGADGTITNTGGSCKSCSRIFALDIQLTSSFSIRRRRRNLDVGGPNRR